MNLHPAELGFCFSVEQPDSAACRSRGAGVERSIPLVASPAFSLAYSGFGFAGKPGEARRAFPGEQGAGPSSGQGQRRALCEQGTAG